MTIAKASKLIGQLAVNRSILLICDIQEKFRKHIQYFDGIVGNSARLLQAFHLLELPILCTEQYPQGLGSTVAELELQKYGIIPHEKTQFSMCIQPVLEEIEKRKAEHVVMCGIEGHVCIQHTVLELLLRDFTVHVVADAVSSRSMSDRLIGLQRVRDSGAFVTSTEALILGLAGGSHHPKFKDLQQIIWKPSHDTGLLPHLKL